MKSFVLEMLLLGALKDLACGGEKERYNADHSIDRQVRLLEEEGKEALVGRDGSYLLPSVSTDRHSTMLLVVLLHDLLHDEQACASTKTLSKNRFKRIKGDAYKCGEVVRIETCMIKVRVISQRRQAVRTKSATCSRQK